MSPRGPRRPQLRTRVVAAVLLITVLVLAAFDVATVSTLHRYLIGQTDSRLRTVLAEAGGPRLRQLLPVGRKIGPAGVFIPGDFNITFVPGVGGGPDVVLERAGPGGMPRLPADLHALAASGHGQNVIARGRAQLRLLAIRADAGTLVGGVSLSQVSKTVGRIKVIVTVGSIAAALLVALGVTLIMRRGLRPIETMATQADRITAGDLTDRVSLQDAQTEVGRLGTALNGMLARIEASIAEREASQELTRRFFADASHELRNPLASLRANAELYQQGALPARPQVDEAMRRIALEARRMSGLVDDMLRLARLDQHPERQNDPVDLTALVTGCAERARLADPERTWQTRVAPGLMAAGDQELLRRAIDNLLANVRAHTPHGTVAAITADGDDGGDGADGGTVTVEVSDNGPGVPADQLPRIFDRFYRAAAQSDPAGSGLGLAIVAAIATTHNGTAEAALNHPRGLRVTLTLPVYTQPGAAEPGAPEPAAAAASAQARQG